MELVLSIIICGMVYSIGFLTEYMYCNSRNKIDDALTKTLKII